MGAFPLYRSFSEKDQYVRSKECPGCSSYPMLEAMRGVPEAGPAGLLFDVDKRQLYMSEMYLDSVRRAETPRSPECSLPPPAKPWSTNRRFRFTPYPWSTATSWRDFLPREYCYLKEGRNC